MGDWALMFAALSSPGNARRRALATPRTIGVLICSYQRPGSLLRGLSALGEQERRPDDVIVVARSDDSPTLEALSEPRADGLSVRVLTVTKPGTVYALNTGLDACRTDILSITDDDTVPHPDWLSRILIHFINDPNLGGLSGRDWCYDGQRFDDGSRNVVGRLQWFGRSIGNHHLVVGPPREVDFFKGANMSYRAEAVAKLRFDSRLRGSGAQPCEDLAFSLAVGISGWKLVYDPLVAIDHYPASRKEPRHYAGARDTNDVAGLYDFAYNEATALWRVVAASSCLCRLVDRCRHRSASWFATGDSFRAGSWSRLLGPLCHRQAGEVSGV